MKQIVGNLLDIESGTILHQVNCMSDCGGLAGALRRKHPGAFAAYFTACTNGGVLGRFVPGVASPSLYIGHVFGQLHPGPNTDMKAVHEALKEAAEFITGKVYAPFKMGCGLGGGNWDDYLRALTQYFPNITIVKRPEDK